MKTIVILLSFALYFSKAAEMPDTDEILKEGKLLFRLEKASWYATDYLREVMPDKEHI